MSALDNTNADSTDTKKFAYIAGLYRLIKVYCRLFLGGLLWLLSH